MSPEHATSAKSVTNRADIYSFGPTLYELFTGHIMHDIHNVYDVMLARLSRGSTASRMRELGRDILIEDEEIAGLVLDMHLRHAKGRPPVDSVCGRLEFEYSRRYGEDWLGRSSYA